MVCLRVIFHENDGNYENDENDEDNSDSYIQGAECWIRGNHGNHEYDENHRNPGCKPQVPQTTGLETPFGIADYCCYTPTYFRKKMAYRNPKTGLGGRASQKKLASEAYRATGVVAWNRIANRATVGH